MSMKNSSDTIGNRTRNLPASSAVTQPTAPPRAPPHRTVQEITVLSHMTALYLNVFLSGIHGCWSQTKEGRLCPNANNCQVQLQTPQIIWVSRSHASSAEAKENMTLRVMKQNVKAERRHSYLCHFQCVVSCGLRVCRADHPDALIYAGCETTIWRLSGWQRCITHE